MKQFALCIASILAFAACAVDAPTSDPASSQDPTTETTSVESSSLEATTAVPHGTCNATSGRPCANAAINASCGVRRWCLPANEYPDGSIFCLCQSQRSD